MEKRFAALRTIGTVYKVLGGIVGALTLLLVLAICASSVLGGAIIGGLAQELGGRGGFEGFFGGAFGGFLISLFVILYGGAIAISLYGFGEGIYLLLALEENTRLTVNLLQGREGPLPPAG
jgi:hypothetical protein